jgi:uncharacterized protein
MGKRESYEPGTFCWVDLTTTDPAGAKAFYTSLFGWEAEDVPAGEAGTYTLLRLDGDEVCGLYEMDAGSRQGGVPPHWLSHVRVEDADAVASRARELGGTVHGEVFDVGEYGRFAIVEDPSGATLVAWQTAANGGARRVNDPGCMTWNEHQTSDSETAGEFYSSLFGWGIGPIEQDGTLVYTTLENAGSRNGGFMPMTGQPDGAPSVWLSYFTVSSCEEALEQARTRGGAVFTGPLDLPGGRIAVLGDPQGGAFAVFEGPVDD